MHKCAEEGRRLAAEWADFYAQQKLSKERAQREAEHVLQVDSQREGTIIRLAKVRDLNFARLFSRIVGVSEETEHPCFHLIQAFRLT